MERLLEHVERHGVKLSWGRGVTPGVGGWYRIGGQDTGMWAMNANSPSPATRAYFQFYLGDLVKKIGADVVERAAQVLEQIPALQPKIAEARISGWNKYPSLYLGDIATDPATTEALFRAIEGMMRPSPS